MLHGFDDNRCIQILNNLVAGAGSSGARIALLEFILDETRPDFASTSFDMQMFMGTHGRERTLKQWQVLFDTSGVKLEQVIGLRGLGSILLLNTRS